VRSCDVRCNGSLFSSDPNGFWSISIGDSYVAVESPLVDVSGEPMALVEQSVSEFLVTQSTFVLRGELVRVSAAQAGSEDDWPRQVQVDADRCVFLGVGKGPSVALTSSSGTHAQEVQNHSIRWRGADDFYAGFSTYFEFGGTQDSMETERLDEQGWLEHWTLSEERHHFGMTRIADRYPGPLLDLPIPSREDLQEIGYPPELESDLGVDASFLPALPSREP
jgi:hypothetical protein